MGILYALLFSGLLNGKKVNVKKTSKAIKKDAKFLVQLITELVELLNQIVNFIFIKIPSACKKHFCQKTVEEELPSNVINFDEYKVKKAK